MLAAIVMAGLLLGLVIMVFVSVINMLLLLTSPFMLLFVVVVAPFCHLTCCLTSKLIDAGPVVTSFDVVLGNVAPSAPVLTDKVTVPKLSALFWTQPFRLAAGKWILVGDLVWDQTGIQLQEEMRWSKVDLAMNSLNVDDGKIEDVGFDDEF